jgi:hypothetical protein
VSVFVLSSTSIAHLSWLIVDTGVGKDCYEVKFGEVSNLGAVFTLRHNTAVQDVMLRLHKTQTRYPLTPQCKYH